MYAETALKVRQIGEYCIRKRLTALENKEEVPQDILTLILRTVRKYTQVICYIQNSLCTLCCKHLLSMLLCAGS